MRHWLRARGPAILLLGATLAAPFLAPSRSAAQSAAPAAAPAAASAAAPAATQEPFRVHTILPLSGPGAFLGQAQQQALRIEEKLVNAEGGIKGRPISFVFHDDQSSPQVAVQLVGQIKPENPSVLLGSTLVAMCMAEAPLTARGPLTYCFSPGVHSKPGSFMYNSSVSTEDVLAAQVRYFRLRGFTKIALISSTDASGQDGARTTHDALKLPENKDVQLVADLQFNPTDVSVAAQIERIRDSGAQAMIAWTTGTSVGTVFKAIVGSGLDIPVGTSFGNMLNAQMDQYAAFLPKELYFGTSGWPEAPENASIPAGVQAAKKRMFAAFHSENLVPDAAPTFPWDAVMMLVDGWRKLGPDASAEQMRSYLAGLQNYAGVNGLYDFVKVPQRGLDMSSVYITIWKPQEHRWAIVSGPGGELPGK